MLFFFFKQKTAYEMRFSDWSSDVCSSDLSRVSRASRRGAKPWRGCRRSFARTKTIATSGKRRTARFSWRRGGGDNPVRHGKEEGTYLWAGRGGSYITFGWEIGRASRWERVCQDV